MTRYILVFFWVFLLTSCHSAKLLTFSGRTWRMSGINHAVSNDGMELSFGSPWLLTNMDMLIQSEEEIEAYPEMKVHLRKAFSLYPEIEVDSIYFYNPARKLVFASYHQRKPLKPITELCEAPEEKDLDGKNTYEKMKPYYDEVFGRTYAWSDIDGWQKGPTQSVYFNLRKNKRDKLMVQLQRLPYNDGSLAIFSILQTEPKKYHSENFPMNPYWKYDINELETIELISFWLHGSQTYAIDNLRLGKNK